MYLQLLIFTIGCLIGVSDSTFAQENKSGTEQKNHRSRQYPAKIAGAKVEVYKTIGNVKLNMYIFQPEGHRVKDRRPAIVFFFGGGWRGGAPSQFTKQAEYFASRGMVAMVADYRVPSPHGLC
jgi:acetyl esterase/lipase